MKKTCYNCRYFHGCLSEEPPSYFHIHNYCTKFNQTLDRDLESEITAFLEEYWYTARKACPGIVLNDDFETGEACCWMFKEKFKEINAPDWPDEKFEENRKYNINNAIKTLEYMFEKDEVWDPNDSYTWYKLDDYFEDDEIVYLKDLLTRLKAEDKNG